MPWPGWEQRHFAERFRPERVEQRTLRGRALLVLTEPLRAGWVHPCTSDDVVAVLERLPTADTDGIGLVVLRQPARKEASFSSAWGRLVYDTRWRHYTGPALILDALDVKDTAFRWTRRLAPDETRELERVRAAGLVVRDTPRSFDIVVDAESARRYQLTRTVPHEVGHWVDWHRKVLRPAARAADEDALAELKARYRARPHAELEAAAHRYADEAQRWLRAS
jgi:hypothetical protein